MVPRGARVILVDAQCTHTLTLAGLPPVGPSCSTFSSTALLPFPCCCWCRRSNAALAAILLTEMLLVFVAKIVSRGICFANVWKMACFTAKFSVAASMTICGNLLLLLPLLLVLLLVLLLSLLPLPPLPSSSILPRYVILPFASLASSSVIRSLATSLERSEAKKACPSRSCLGEVSQTVTLHRAVTEAT